MNIKLSWDNEEKTVYLIVFERGFDWNDYDSAIDKLWADIAAVQHRVHVIGVLPEGVALPKGLPLTHLARAAQHQPPNVDLVVMVNFNPFAKALIKALIRLNVKAAKSSRFAATVEEAYELIEQEKGHV